MEKHELPCPHCGGRTELLPPGSVTVMRNSTDGVQYEPYHPDRDRVLHCLDCDRTFTEQHAQWAATERREP